MTHFKVPTRGEVSENNQAIFDKLKKGLGFVPNLYATYAHSKNALGNYLNLQNAPTSLKAKEKEVVNLVVSQVNGCRYCQSAHTAIGKMNGFTDDQILEIRGGRASFDVKLNALAQLTQNIVETKGHPETQLVDHFFEVGYTKENLIDTIVLIGDKTISNFLHGITQIPIDFPLAPELEDVLA